MQVKQAVACDIALATETRGSAPLVTLKSDLVDTMILCGFWCLRLNYEEARAGCSDLGGGGGGGGGGRRGGGGRAGGEGGGLTTHMPFVNNKLQFAGHSVQGSLTVTTTTCSTCLYEHCAYRDS
jgi:hypothetical protein